MVKFRDWILQKTGVTSLTAAPDLIAVGDFNLTSSVDVLAIMSMPLVHANGRDYIMANPAAKARTTLWTNPALSDHNGLAASFDLPLLHDRYEKWVLDAFTDGELRSGLGLPGQDADGDGKSNFTEYAENHHPWRPLPAPVSSGLKEGRPFAAFRRGANRTDVRFTLHHSPDLNHWSPAAIAEGAGPANAVGKHAISETLLENNETSKLEIFAEKTAFRGSTNSKSSGFLPERHTLQASKVISLPPFGAQARFIPITDNLRAWIEPLPKKGKLVRHAGMHREVT